MRVPFSLRQLKGQLKALQRANPATQIAPASLLWQKFGAAKQAAKKLAGVTPTPPPPAKPRKKAPPNEVRLAYYTSGDPYSYNSLEQHAALITHLCPEWITVVNGSGDIQIDADSRLPKFCAGKGIALMPLLTNLVGDTWQPEAIENLAHGPAERQERFFAKVVTALRDAKARGVVIDWEQIDRTSIRPARWVRDPGLKAGSRCCSKAAIANSGSFRLEATDTIGPWAQKKPS